MASFEEDVTKLNVKGIVVTTVLSAFGFLVALTWRDAIQQTIDRIIPPGEDLFYSYVAAILVTVIAVVAAYILIKIQRVGVVPPRTIVNKEPVRKRRRLRRTSETNKER